MNTAVMINPDSGRRCRADVFNKIPMTTIAILGALCVLRDGM
jgi:hypothetical protein